MFNVAAPPEAAIKPLKRTEGSTVPCQAPFPPCPNCSGPLKLRFDNTYAYCLNQHCDFDGINAGEVIGEDGQPERGLPRPTHKGRPVPWVAPVIGDQVAWAGLNSSRIHEAERQWLCQVCGNSLDPAPTAWVAVSQGEVATGGALHQGCMDEARIACPTLRDDASYVFTEVRREDQAHDWSSVIERLITYEKQRGQLPRVVALSL